jgi:hypothetical protein
MSKHRGTHNVGYDLKIAANWRDKVRMEMNPRAVVHQNTPVSSSYSFTSESDAEQVIYDGHGLLTGSEEINTTHDGSETTTSTSSSSHDEINLIDRMRESVISLRRYHDLSAEAHKEASKRNSRKSKWISKLIIFVGFVTLCAEGAFRLWGNDDQENISGVIGVVIVAALSEINRSRGYFKKKHEHLRVRDEHLRSIHPIDFAFKFEREHPDLTYDYSSLLLDLQDNQNIIASIGRKIPKAVLKIQKYANLGDWNVNANIGVNAPTGLAERESFEE